MERKVEQDNPELRQPAAFLAAVSGGVDSMVLLTLLEKLKKRWGFQFAVAHVNHRLREASEEEAAFLKAYCQDRQLPYFEKVWQDPISSEAAARQFRYAFFREVMQKGYPCLLTAHHGDDQIETMLLRFVRGSSLAGHGGIKRQQAFGTGTLLRPLLSFSKEEIYHYAEIHTIPFFEDESNQTLEYTRNRMRHQVLPVLKQENPRLLEHADHFHQQLQWADEWIRETLKENLKNVVFQADEVRFERQDLPDSNAGRYYFLSNLFQQQDPDNQLELSQRQLVALVGLLGSEQPQWDFDIGKDWRFVRRYEQFSLNRAIASEDDCRLLNLGETVQLGDWRLRLSESLESKPAASGQRIYLSQETALPLTIRHRQPGDRIRLNKQLTKKVNRYFIDQKIPREAREAAWLVVDSSGEILSILNFVNSYLSIENETDRIHYVLDFYRSLD
ncbi:tRNA(Ile)-lysidine synthase [Enterococcus florum]|uniref:tRNA(Ile)-lysidine synthase n=1 Tax=Enterococcus florum TaxID=2480627 RepID=A0A4P5PC76_9ENTE|nr:tRNA lysidine(34) synthetase TilS [Enterococcus florum]GCF95817.1 tRNA(Ile)-lysidine synthase [Enterococcus florum]